MLLRARIVLPVNQPPIENGGVAISGNRITWVGSWQERAASVHSEIQDLGEVILMPGLVNAHCHLDYTGMSGQIPPSKSFTDWIRAIVALKGSWTNEEFAQSWNKGAEMLLRTGTTTVADVESVPDLLPAVWRATPLRVITLRELINLRSPAEALVKTAERELAALPGSEGRIGLSPHAPYTTTAELLQLAALTAKRRNWPLVTHVAESEEEYEMYLYRHGALFEWLKSQRDMSDCGLGSPLNHLERNDYLSERLIAVHVNYLCRDDAPVLGRYNVSVAHCPRSHAYFRHLLFPRNELVSTGVNICLGTDSLATVLKEKGNLPELNMFAEMRAFADKFREVSPATILEMATVNGARALGRTGQLGQISENAMADLIALPYSDKLSSAGEFAVHFQGNVAGSMIDGNWAITPREASSPARPALQS